MEGDGGLTVTQLCQWSLHTLNISIPPTLPHPPLVNRVQVLERIDLKDLGQK